MGIRKDDAGLTEEELAAMNGPVAEDEPEATQQAAHEDVDAEVPEDTVPVVQAEAEAEPEPETEGDEPEPVLAVAPAKFDVPATDFDAARKAIKSEKRDLMKQWTDGNLDDAQYADQLEAVDEKLHAVTVEAIRTSTLHEVNEQNERRAAERAQDSENAAMVKVAAASLAANLIDYGADTHAAAMFDSVFNAAKVDPRNASLTTQQLAEKAHKAVLMDRGLVAPAPPTPIPTPRAKLDRSKLPQTLGNLPAAASQPVGQDLSEQLDAIDDPDMLEARWSQLPASQRTAMLRATMPAARRR